MRRSITLGMAVIGGAIASRAIASRAIPPASRHRLTAGMRRRLLGRMEAMMASLPDDAPPKLIVSLLPRLRDQNDRIIALLQEQNELLRGRPAADQQSTPGVA